MLYPNFGAARMRQSYPAFCKQHNVLTFYGFAFDHLSKQFFTLITSVDIGVIKRVNSKLQAEINNCLHLCMGQVAIDPPVKTVYCRRNFGTRIAEINFFHVAMNFARAKNYLISGTGNNLPPNSKYAQSKVQKILNNCAITNARAGRPLCILTNS